MELIDAVQSQVKAEIDGAELTNDQKFVLRQKYGLVPYTLTDKEVDWYLSLSRWEGGEL